MKTTRLLCVLALCASIGVPATLAVSEDCRKAAFDLVWKAKVRAMQGWDNDPKNRAYVERHKLKTADLSRATAALRARMLKALDVACGPESLTEGARRTGPATRPASGRAARAAASVRAGRAGRDSGDAACSDRAGCSANLRLACAWSG